MLIETLYLLSVNKNVASMQADVGLCFVIHLFVSYLVLQSS